jgi:hypothetical protein
MPSSAQPGTAHEDALWIERRAIAPVLGQAVLFEVRPPAEALVLRGVIHVSPLPSMKNDLRAYILPGIRPRAMIVQSKEVKDFFKRVRAAHTLGDFEAYESQLPLRGTTTLEEWRRGDGARLVLEAVVYADALRRDLDVEVVKDALQHVRLVDNDRGIWEIHARREIDVGRPRVEFAVYVGGQ